MREREIRRDSLTAEPGRIAYEHIILKPVASELTKRGIPADAITVFGAFAGVLATWLLSSPEDTGKNIEKISGGRFKLTKGQTRTIGGLLLGISYFCDLLDGPVARLSEQGETKHGMVMDGVVNKIVDTSLAVFELAKATTLDTKATWMSYLTLAPVSTMIRSVGIQHNIPIPKTGLGARIGRIPFIVGAMFFEEKRNLLGKILLAQLVGDSIHRYLQIVRSTNKEARGEVNRDLGEYFVIALLSRTIPQKGFPRELVTLGLELAKLAQVKIQEAYGKDK